MTVGLFGSTTKKKSSAIDCRLAIAAKKRKCCIHTRFGLAATYRAPRRAERAHDVRRMDAGRIRRYSERVDKQSNCGKPVRTRSARPATADCRLKDLGAVIPEPNERGPQALAERVQLRSNG